jgi:hypothetical protein
MALHRNADSLPERNADSLPERSRREIGFPIRAVSAQKETSMTTTAVGPLLLSIGAATATAALAWSVAADPFVRSAGHGAGGLFALSQSCGTPELSDEEVDRIEQVAAALRRKLKLPPPAAIPLGTVSVYFHCIYANQGGAPVGLLTMEQVEAQIEALSAKFDNLDFELAGVDFTENNEWFAMTPGSPEELEAKSALAVDPTRYLNLYSAGLQGGLGGWAYFPWSLPPNSPLDGVVILYSTVPGGGLPGYDQGEICVHEVGHWAGLYHTFQGRCNPLNDRVADTPAEKTAASGCPAARDTCRSAGNDPIHNYMDYTNDICRSEFTTGQYIRMNDLLQIFRSDAVVPPPAARSTSAPAPPSGAGRRR